MSVTPTHEQELIISAAVETNQNLMISALAGAAKTSTLVMVAHALEEAQPKTRILCLAFNKKIATEMTERLPKNCTAMTLNSLGHRVWADVLSRRLTISPGKVGDIIKTLIDEIDDVQEKEDAWDVFSDLVRAVSFAKQCGYIPDGYSRPSKRLMGDEEFRAHYEIQLEDWEWELVRRASIISLDMAFQATLDYDDQILLPTVFQAVFPRYPLILIDEAQDLSSLNHATLQKLVVNRIIAVGDSCQAIYGFRGAHEDSMNLLQETFNMQLMKLTTSFRCPVQVVEHARWRAPEMKYPTWAKEGAINVYDLWGPDDIPPSAAVICRNNAPLFSLAIRLLKAGRYAELVGNDIGRNVVKAMSKLGPKSMKKKELLSAIDAWEKEKAKKFKNKKALADRADCMRIFAEQGKDLGDAIAYAEHILSSGGPVKLMTGHKSKGLEFDNVFILDSNLIGDEGQERNLRYVMITRAKDTLSYIDSANFE